MTAGPLTGPSWDEWAQQVRKFYAPPPAYPTDTEEDAVRNELARAVLRGEYNEVNINGLTILVPDGLHNEVATLLNIGLMQVGYRADRRYRVRIRRSSELAFDVEASSESEAKEIASELPYDQCVYDEALDDELYVEEIP